MSGQKNWANRKMVGFYKCLGTIIPPGKGQGDEDLVYPIVCVSVPRGFGM